MRLVVLSLLIPMLLLANAQQKVELAIRYAQEQELERAFCTFLQALDETAAQPPPQLTEAEKVLYEEAQKLYLSESSSKAKQVAARLRQEYGNALALHPDYYRLQYLLALAYANSGDFEEFFARFYPSYRHLPNHYLADKTRALLDLKLMLWAKTPEEKARYRQRIYQSALKGLAQYQGDYGLYKMAIAFAPSEKKAEVTATSLNNMLAAPMILPREEFLFFIKEAAETGRMDLAQRLLEQAKSRYGEGRAIRAAEEWMAGYKGA